MMMVVKVAVVVAVVLLNVSTTMIHTVTYMNECIIQHILAILVLEKMKATTNLQPCTSNSVVVHTGIPIKSYSLGRRQHLNI